MQTPDQTSSGFKLFGFTIARAEQPQVKSFVPEKSDSAPAEVTTNGFYSYSVNLDPSAITENADLISKYREISLVSEIDIAVSEVVNEIVSADSEDDLLKIDFHPDLAKSLSDKTKNLITAEFRNVVKLMGFDVNGLEIVRDFYVDGAKAYHKIVDEKKPKDGIIQLRPIDVAKLKKVVEVSKSVDNQTGATLITGQQEYFVYAEQIKASAGYSQVNETTGLKISPDSIAYSTCGYVDRNLNRTIGYLYKAIRPLNQLRMMEDSDVIYRMTRAPERRVFNIDTSGLTRSKAEQHIQQTMDRYKNKVVYDAASGVVKTDKKFTAIVEDYWFPRGANGKGTTIDVLQGGQGLGSIENTEYFQNKLYMSLNIPIGRLQPQQGAFALGRQSEITRDEIKFAKFVEGIRRRFNVLLLDILKTQLILKGITSPEDWDNLKPGIKFIYASDNFWAELKNSDLLKDRLQTVAQADAFVGKYLSREYIQRKVLRLTDDELEEINKQIDAEAPPPEEIDTNQPPIQ